MIGLADGRAWWRWFRLVLLGIWLRSRLKLVLGRRYEAYTGMTAVCQGWLSEEALASLVFTPLCMRPLCVVWVHVSAPFHVTARAPAPIRLIYCRLSPRWPVVQDGTDLCALREGLVRNQVWQQGRWANAPCRAHIEALAGQLTSLWLLNVPPRRLRDRLWPNAGRSTPAFSHTILSRATFSHKLLHTTFSHATLSHTTRSHSYSILSRTQLFEITDPPPSPLSFLVRAQYRFNPCM